MESWKWTAKKTQKRFCLCSDKRQSAREGICLYRRYCIIHCVRHTETQELLYHVCWSGTISGKILAYSLSNISQTLRIKSAAKSHPIRRSSLNVQTWECIGLVSCLLVNHILCNGWLVLLIKFWKIQVWLLITSSRIEKSVYVAL